MIVVDRVFQHGFPDFLTHAPDQERRDNNDRADKLRHPGRTDPNHCFDTIALDDLEVNQQVLNRFDPVRNIGCRGNPAMVEVQNDWTFDPLGPLDQHDLLLGEREPFFVFWGLDAALDMITGSGVSEERIYTGWGRHPELLNLSCV